MVGRINRQRAESATSEAPHQPQPWAWARHWEFWLALALGAFLRLWRLDLTQYLDDQTRLMTLTRASVTRGLIPLTGIPSSIHTLNPPLSVYLLLPFAALTANPMPVVVSIALWNVLGVALTYVFTLRYFGRRVAAMSALLFATCGAVINYSRFIWQQNYLPPLLALWALTLFMGVVEGRRRWFAGNVTLLALAALLHPTAALLAPVTLLGVALAPRLPRLRAWIVAAVVLVALAMPTLIWEALSGFSDISAARRYALGQSHTNLTVLYYLFQAISGPVSSGAISVFFIALNGVALLLFALGWLALTARIVRPARALPWRSEAGLIAAARAWLLALWRGLRADAAWRANVLLWFSVTLPPALMLRHSGGLFAHYLMVLYPTAFIVSGIGAVVAMSWLAALVERRAVRVASAVTLVLEAGLLVLMLARSAQWISYPLSLTDARTFNAYHDYGYPLSVLQGGAATLDMLQAQTSAANVEVITASDPRYRLPEEYILASERNDRVSVTPSCLALPASDARSWLVAPVISGSPAAALLGHLTNAQRVGALPLLGGPTYPVYQVSGETPLQPGETRLRAATFDDHHGDTLTLLSATLPQSRTLLLRWQVDAAATPTGQTRQFRFVASSGGATAYTDCAAQHWQPGETLFTWLSLRVGGTSAITLRAQTATSGLATPSAGGLHFLADAPEGAPLTSMALSVGAADSLRAQVVAGADGSLTIPAGALPPAP